MELAYLRSIDLPTGGTLGKTLAYSTGPSCVYGGVLSIRGHNIYHIDSAERLD